MESTDTPLSKAEYIYMRTIEKADALIAKQEASLKKEKSDNEQLTKESETLKSVNGTLTQQITALKSENEKLKADLLETTKECQLHIDAIEKQNDELQHEVEELKTQVLSDEEKLFYDSCVADIILAELHQQKREFTIEELREKKFPEVLLETEGEEPSGIETGNFTLIKNNGENKYQLSQK